MSPKGYTHDYPGEPLNPCPECGDECYWDGDFWRCPKCKWNGEDLEEE